LNLVRGHIGAFFIALSQLSRTYADLGTPVPPKQVVRETYKPFSLTATLDRSHHQRRSRFPAGKPLAVLAVLAAAAISDRSILFSTTVLITQLEPIIPNIEVRRPIIPHLEVVVQEEVVVRA
jgi:hypothetical protein